jgi:ComF family protein
MRWALHVLLPESCCACSEDLPPPLSGPLCGACTRLLRRRKLPRPQPRMWLHKLRAAFKYQSPASDLIRAYKYRGLPVAGIAAAGWMAGRWTAFPELHNADVLTAVPLHRRRQRSRGFNQAQTLALAVARSSGLPLEELLLRPTAAKPRARTRPQNRRAVTRSIYAPHPKARICGRRIILIDDVATTGATLEACARILWKEGAADVSGYVFAA